MKSYFLLLRLNLRNLLAGFRGAMRKPNGKIDISRLILYPLALLGMLTLAGFVIFMEFSMFSAFEMLNAPEMLPGLAILLAMVTALLFSVFQMLAALYFSRDTASMAYLPLTSRTVLAAKWTEVYVSELLFSLLIYRARRCPLRDSLRGGLDVLSADGARAAGGQLYPADDFAPAGKHSGALHVADPA